MTTRPLIGITADIVIAGDRLKADVGLAYAQCIARAGGTPIILPPIPEAVEDHLALCHAFVFTGGDDPRTEEFGVPTHPQATLMHPQRQAYELALLRLLQQRKDTPVLGVCLGMQLMSLVNKGRLNQRIAEANPQTAHHWDSKHTIRLTSSAQARRHAHDESASRGLFPLAAATPTTLVTSRHKQAVTDPGALRVLATSEDDIIEAVDDPSRKFYLGVQWHPERTPDPALGQRIFDEFLKAARA